MNLDLAPFVLLAGGLALVAWGWRRRQALGILPRDWLAVNGTSVATGDGQPGLVEYRTPDGRRLRLPVPAGVSFEPGDDVRVLVDPRDGSRARLVAGEELAARVARNLMLLGGSILVLAALAALAFL